MDKFAYLSSRSIWDEVIAAGIIRGNVYMYGIDSEAITWPIKTNGNLKLSYLWNDRICLPFPEDFSEYIIEVSLKGHKLSFDCEKEIRESLVSVDKATNLNDQIDQDLENCILNVAESICRIKEENSDEPGGFLDIEKAIGAGTSMIYKTLKNWYLLNKISTCSLYGITEEYKAFDQIYQNSKEQEKTKTLNEISGIRLPNLESTPWEKIIELRYSKYIEDFRSKIDHVIEQLRQREIKNANLILEEIISKDLREIARKAKPNPKTTLLKGIAGSWFPLLPISPIGLGITLNDYQNEIEREEDYGWLYFVLDLES